MADSGSLLGSITDAGKDIAREAKKQTTTGIATSVKSQIIGTDTEEEIAKKKQERMQTYARIQQIEAEMAQLRALEEQRKNVGKEQEQKKDLKQTQQNTKEKKMDEASRQAVGKSELGRNYKG